MVSLLIAYNVINNMENLTLTNNIDKQYHFKHIGLDANMNNVWYNQELDKKNTKNNIRVSLSPNGNSPLLLNTFYSTLGGVSRSNGGLSFALPIRTFCN